MKLFWDDTNEDVGGHYLKLTHDDGVVIDEVFLRDYTCGYQKRIEKPEKFKNIKFEYSYCNGFSSHNEITDNISLSEAKIVVEKWFVNLYMNTLKNTKIRLEGLKGICNYLESIQAGY